jgi:hypothetical protein
MKSARAWWLFACAVVTLVIAPPSGWGQDQSVPIVVRETMHAFAPPLSQTAPLSPKTSPDSARENGERQFTRYRSQSTGTVQDEGLQALPAQSASSALSSLSTTAGLDFLGLGNGFPGYSIQDTIPSTNGAAGTTQYVQFVNNSFAVFNKSNGSLVYGPAGINTLWQSLGAPCSTNANMDGIAQFDKLANVWVMLMPIYPDPTYLCIAVSTTSDATGSWNLYAFELAQSSLCGCRLMPDYPKLAVWPDAYYISYHQALDLNYEGPAACAVNRTAMLSGKAATMQCFTNTGTSHNAWLPSDLDGTTPPPGGTPNYYVAFDPNDQSLDIWQFHVNWNTPANSTFTGPTNIPVPAFVEPCGDDVTVFTPQDNCVPQAATSEMLGAFGDELMYRVAYRNFGNYQALVANHTVQVGTGSNQTGIRWYELQNSGSGFALYQNGTYAPDSNYRWMGSIAMDNAGDIAMGYNVSSSSMSPSIRYTGRLATDPLGQMETENDALSAANVNTSSLTSTYRWGDYSSLAVDPSDDCTFWYTTEYIPRNTNHWATRIASFKFPSCGSVITQQQWSIVNKASHFGNPISSLSIPPTGSGNLIAIAVMFNGSTSVSSVTDNAGNIYLSAGARSTRGILSTEIWYVASSNSGATVITPHFTGSPTHVEITEWEVSGLSTGAPDAVNTASGSVTTNNTAGPAVTTNQAGDFILSVLFANQASFTAITPGNEFSDDFATDGNGWAHITSNSAAAGTHQPSWYTASPVGVYCASTVAFLP